MTLADPETNPIHYLAMHIVSGWGERQGEIDKEIIHWEIEFRELVRAEEVQSWQWEHQLLWSLLVHKVVEWFWGGSIQHKRQFLIHRVSGGLDKSN